MQNTPHQVGEKCVVSYRHRDESRQSKASKENQRVLSKIKAKSFFPEFR